MRPCVIVESLLPPGGRDNRDTDAARPCIRANRRADGKHRNIIESHL